MGSKRKNGLIRAALALTLLATPVAAWAKPCSVKAFIVPVTMDGLKASIPVKINGKKAKFWLDTGADLSTMPLAEAKALNLPLTTPHSFLEMSGIGGKFSYQVASVKTLSIAGAVLHRVQIIAGGSDMGAGLLGRDMFGTYDLDLDFGHSRFGLMMPQGNCRKVGMAYWTNGKPYFTVKLIPPAQIHDPMNPMASNRSPIRDIRLHVKLNGKDVIAEIDSGATTVIDLKAAQAAGIDLNGPDVQKIDGIGGLGRHFEKGWSVRLKSVSIGQETIMNPRLTVIDGPIIAGQYQGQPDMLLGIGYLLSHHLYVSRKQNLIYFTYEGGMPFIDQDKSDKLANATTGAAASKGAKPKGSATAPQTADQYARAGAVMLSRQDTKGAIKAFSQAISMSPDTAKYYRLRADADFQAQDAKAGLADLKEAAALDPKDGATLIALASAYDNQGNWQQAYETARRAQVLAAPQSLQMADVANIYANAGHAAQAVPLFDKVIASHRDGSNLGVLLASQCWARGLADAEIDRADRDCKRALKLSGNSPVIRDSLALVLYRQKKYSDALDNYNQVLKAQPREAWSLYMRGMTETALGKAAMGAADRKAALKLQPDLIKRAKAYGLAAPARQSGE